MEATQDMRLTMKSIVGCALLIFTVIGGQYSVYAKDRQEAAIGLLLGEPSGINGQVFWSSRSAVDLTVAWSWSDWVQVIGDYQIYDYILDAPREWKWTYGLGAYLALPENEGGTFGVRVPVGVKYHWPHSYIDTWIELAPALQVAPDTEARLQAGIGITYWLW